MGKESNTQHDVVELETVDAHFHSQKYKEVWELCDPHSSMQPLFDLTPPCVFLLF